MDSNKFKSIALNISTYDKLKHLSLYRFEMPHSMAKVAAFLISKAYDLFEEMRREKEADDTWELVKDFEPN
tara:strand:- start:473 stop:685 length:213 start_codon:yes stop_codon:yes gene_type:complete